MAHPFATGSTAGTGSAPPPPPPKGLVDKDWPQELMGAEGA